MIVVEYEDEEGRSPFGAWFDSLNVPAALKVRTATIRTEQGNFSDMKPVGQGVSECRLDFGPGYRIYFGRDGDKLVILLGGGTKKRQSRDIDAAKNHWAAFKSRKRKG